MPLAPMIHRAKQRERTHAARKAKGRKPHAAMVADGKRHRAWRFR